MFDALPKPMPRVISIGRLDFNTEGLLLLTNDGALARHLELPSTGWMRRYRVRAHGAITQEALDKLKDGIEINGVRYGPIEATLEKPQGTNVWLRIGLREGKNREVRTILETPGPGREPPDPHLLRAVPAAGYGAGHGRAGQGARADRASGCAPAAELGVRVDEEDAALRPSRRPSPRAGHEDRRRASSAAGRWPRRRTRARAPPPTACARPCSTSCARHRRISPSKASRCSTCSPAPARWASKPCRAAPPSACSSRRTPTRAPSSAATSRRFGLTGVTKIFRRDATDLGPAGNRGAAGLVFLDPPYGKGLAERALASAASGGWLAPGAVAVIEERKGVPVALPASFALLDRRTWGDTEVIFRQSFGAGSAQGHQ